jgi:hypothetical protein
MRSLTFVRICEMHCKDLYMTDCDSDYPLLGCNLVGMHQHFSGTCFLHLYSTCIMFLHRSQKQFQLMLVPIYQTTWSHTSEHHNFNVHKCKNLESHTVCDVQEFSIKCNMITTKYNCLAQRMFVIVCKTT